MQKLKIIRTVTCILEHKNKILLLKRSRKSKAYGEVWGGISGYIEGRESPDSRVRKEIVQETGIKKARLVRSGKILSVLDKDLGIKWLVKPYLFDSITRKVKLNRENTSYKWINLSDIKKYKTVPKFKETVFRVLK